MGKQWSGAWRLLARLFVEPTRRRHLYIITASILVCCYAGAVLAYVVLTPELGIRCAFSTTVGQFYPEFLAFPQRETLRPGDTVLKIGHRTVENWPQYLRVTVELAQQRGQEIDWRTVHEAPTSDALPEVMDLPEGHRLFRVRVRSPGEEEPHSVILRLGPPLAATVVPSLLWFFLKIGLFAVGAIVYWKRPEESYSGLLFLLCIVLLGAYIGGYHWSQIITQPVLLIVFMICSVLLPAVSLHFYLVFPRPKPLISQRWLLVLYTPPLLFLVLIFTGYLRIRWLYYGGGSVGSQDALLWLLSEIMAEIYTYFGVSALYYLATVICLIHSYSRAIDAVERNQVKWILYGAAAAMLPIGYTLYLAFFDPPGFASGGATWPMFAASALVTAAFTISITRYRLMQLDKLISSGVIYFVISSLAGMVYYGLVFTGMLLVGAQFGDGPSLAQALTVSSTALLLLIALDLARSRFKGALDYHFRRQKHQLDKTLLRMRLAVDQLVDPPTLARRLLQTAAELLGAARGAVYLRQDYAAVYRLADTLGPVPTQSEIPAGSPLVEVLRTQGSLLVGPRLQMNDQSQRVLHSLRAEVGSGLLHEGQLLGILILGPRETGSYNAEDINLLAAFNQLTVLALMSAEGHRTIQTLNRELANKVDKIAEQQRRIVMLQSQLMNTSSQEKANKTFTESDQATAVPSAAVAEASSSLIGSSAQIRDLVALIRKVAVSQSAVLLRGESGVGKEVLARMIHENSPRASCPFIKVHCAALSSSLLESELFGHVKGAFTNAIRDKVGRFEAAHKGTLFLDEIGDITLEVQTKLLRVIQEMSFERVGSSETIEVDVRIIAATHQNLEEFIEQGRFREDLFYRLNVFPIQVPPLRDHVEDIPELAQHFLVQYAQRANKQLAGIDDDALAILKGYSWPGNIRQLENVIERAVVLVDGPTITAQELPPEMQAEAELPLREPETMPAHQWQPIGTLHTETQPSLSRGVRGNQMERERDKVIRALSAAGGNKAEAARALGLARSTLLSKLKRLGLS
jgi:transcriptional regulator with GAF, ATPase, and Fis domain